MRGFAVPVWAVPRGTEGVRIMTEAVADSMTIAACLAGTGLTESTLADADAEIWAHQEFMVVGNIIARLGDRPGLGVDVGGFSTLGRLGVLGFAFLTSATVREGFERILPYQALLPSHVRFSIQSDGARDYVVADDSDIPPEIQPFIVERDLAGLAAVLAGANIPVEVEWVETTLDEQRAKRLAKSWSLTSDVRAGCPVNRIAGAPGTLDVPLPQGDPNTTRVFERQCRELLDGRLSRVGVAGQLRSRLMHHQHSLPSMQTIADELHLDPRTLRRKLTDEATSYRDVIAEVRRTRAEQLLSGHDSIEMIARRLGYAETASFTHAFKRWTGLTPSEFRRTSRDERPVA
ncbi:AraC family transcriptional regulator ligand-binding domain-containing protein [Mycolicibacterium sp.]|uniref:AraC family transcriptional regulator n=1 Tax=Mycolicibacterium sp. TaxID=2320850 RepID=UPI0028ACA689|nr:AraC family transcriptional regulator ligand-binding domain-containing protein [Mycolicibacterium sp.]